MTTVRHYPAHASAVAQEPTLDQHAAGRESSSLSSTFTEMRACLHAHADGKQPQVGPMMPAITTVTIFVSTDGLLVGGNFGKHGYHGEACSSPPTSIAKVTKIQSDVETGIVLAACTNECQQDEE